MIRAPAAVATESRTGRGSMEHKQEPSGRGGRRQRLSRRALLRWSALAGGSMLAFNLPLRTQASAEPARPVIGGTAPGSLPSTITSVMQKPRYANATWNLLVTDLSTGQALQELDPDQLAFTGSVRKLFSVGLALNKNWAPDHRFTTSVFRNGTVDSQGALQGDLVLVAAGDLTLGGRLQADGTIAFTDFDHNMPIIWARPSSPRRTRSMGSTASRSKRWRPVYAR